MNNNVNPALAAFMAYMQTKSATKYSDRLKNSFISEKDLAKIQSQQRSQTAQQLAEQWDMYRTGDMNEGRINQARAAAGTTLQGAAEFQRAMANNYMLAMLPHMAGGAVSNGVNILKSLGLNSAALNSLGKGAASVASTSGSLAHMARYAQYVNPLAAVTSMGAHHIRNAAVSMTGNAALGNLLAGPMMALALPMLGKFTSTIANKLTGSGISHKNIRKLRPLSIDGKMRQAAEFVDQEPMQYVNQLTNQLYALDPKGEHINVVDLAQLNMLAKIASYTSSMPILTADIINGHTEKSAASKMAYNYNLSKAAMFYKGQNYTSVISKHAERMEHGQFAHTFGENLGLAATEASSFLNKMSIATDLIKQLQIVFSGGNIKEEMHKFDKVFQTTLQRKSSIFANRLGIGKEESYVNMYYSINESAQNILARSKSFEDVQAGLLSGIYEFTRMTAVETATIRTKGYGIKEPVKYNVIGEQDSQAKGIMNWMSNKIPFFEFFRMLAGGARNTLAYGAQKLGWHGALSILGSPHAYRYHNETYNRMAEGFDIKRETTLLERLTEPFIEKLNKKILNIPLLRIFGNENRLSLEKRARLRYQEPMEKEIATLMKEVGLEKLESQQLYYKYATTTMPDQFDIMIHHLSNVALFTHAIMINTANLSQAIAGQGLVEKPKTRVTRSMNRYTGKLETEAEAKEFMRSAMKAVVGKAKENAFETKKSWARFADVLKYGFKKGSRKGDDENDLAKGIAEGFLHFYEKEKNTASSSWHYATEMMYRPLFTEDFLKNANNPEALKSIMSGSINAEKLMRIRHNFGATTFSELPTASSVLNQYAKIKANNHNEEECLCVNISEKSLKSGAEYIVKELAKIDKYRKNKSAAKALISSDNTLEGMKIARKEDITDIEILQNSYLRKIAINTTKLLKFFGIRGIFSNFFKRKSSTGGSDSGDSGIFSWLGTALGGLGAGDLLKRGGELLTNPDTLAAGGAVATAAAGLYGIYESNYGRAKPLINELDKMGIIDYNIIGNSKILNYKAISKLPLEQISLLASFDDWDKKDKQFLQSLLTQKNKLKISSDKQMKNVIHSSHKFEKYIKNQIASNEKKQGTFSYWTGVVSTSVVHSVGDVLTLGGLFSSITSKDKKLYYQLESAGAISFSVMPFVKSEVRDWAIIDKLDIHQIKSLLKLNWTKDDEQRLKTLLQIRIKQKHALGHESKRFEHKIKHTLKTATQKISKLSGNSIISELENKGIIDHHWIGDSEIKDWNAIKSLDKTQLKKVMDFNDWDDETKKRLQSLYYAKIGKQIADQRNGKNAPDVLSGAVDVDKLTQEHVNDSLQLLEGIFNGINQLINISATGHSEQVKATLATAHAIKNSNTEKHLDTPIHD